MYATLRKTLTDTTEQTILEVPSSFLCHISYVFVANHGGSTNNVDLFWEENNVPQVYLLDNKNINGGDRDTLGGQSDIPIFVLHEGEILKAQASNAGNVEIAVTFNLLFDPINLSNFNFAG